MYAITDNIKKENGRDKKMTDDKELDMLHERTCSK